MQAARRADTIGGRSAARLLLLVAVLVVAADQLTKTLAVARLEPGVPEHAFWFVRWTLQRNPGAAFSFLTRFPIVFTILATTISVVIIVRARSVRERSTGVVMGLVLGGALGNLTDRIFRPPAPLRGYVIDFIDLRKWPVFNIADASIVIGAFLLVFATWRHHE